MSWTEQSPRTLRHVASDVWRDASLLIQQHVELAAEEASERTAGLSVDVALAVAAIALLHGAVLAVLASAGFALHAAGLAPWLAVALVALLAVLAGAGFALWARARLRKRTTTHSETLLALGETSEWIADALRGDRS